MKIAGEEKWTDRGGDEVGPCKHTHKRLGLKHV